MATRPWQLAELILGERVLHEAHRAVRVELLAVARDDAGRLLPAVLERVEPEISHVRGFGVAEDAENAALVVEMVVAVVVVSMSRHARRRAWARWLGRGRRDDGGGGPCVGELGPESLARQARPPVCPLLPRG